MRQPVRLPVLALGAALGLAVAMPANADVITMPETPAASIKNTQAPPKTGQSMDTVVARLGQPAARRGPVGDPPITRWDYEGMIVVFEYDKVITTVIPAAPSPIYNREELTRGR